MIDFDRLLKLRVVIARIGEMDNARWWNTTGQLGTLGETVLKRNFPRSYRVAAAKSVFAVANARCNEIFNPPSSMTLWNLPADLEDAFDAQWEQWIDKRDEWEPFFGSVAVLKASSEVAAVLREWNLITAADEEAVYNFCTELLTNQQVSDQTFQAAKDKFGERGVVDLIGVTGYYQLVSMLLNVDRYPLPEGVQAELKQLR
jgi:hypothetical protein